MWSPRRYRESPWTAPPARAIRYSIVERIVDWYSGRHDGRHGIPSVPVELVNIGPHDTVDASTAAAFGTHRLEQIRHHHHGRMDGELNAFLRFCEDSYDRKTQADEQVKAGEAAVAALRDLRDVAKEQPTEEQLRTRRTAESDRLPELVRQRRLGEHRRQLNAVEERLTAAESELSSARAVLEKIERTVRGRWALTLVRAHRLHEHAHRRAHVYWRQVVRQHPQGDVLNGALANVGPDLPEWARHDAPIPWVDQTTQPRNPDEDTSAPDPHEKGGHSDPQDTAPQAAPDSRA